MAAARRLKRWLINGVVITIPLVLTIMIILLVVNFILGLIGPFTNAVAIVWSDEPPEVFIQTLTVIRAIALILLVGIVADYTPGAHLTDQLDRLIATIPITSTIYAGAQQASELLVDDTSEQFQDVLLVEFLQAAPTCLDS